MLKRKAFNRIFVTTIVFFVVFSFYNLKMISSGEVVNRESVNYDKEVIYTLNNDNYISKAEVYVSKTLTLKDKIKEKLETMVCENNKNALLPSYFKPILPENTEILDVVVNDSLVKLFFSKELNNIDEEQSEKMIEAIIYTITDENILGVEIYADGKLLKYVPHTKKELPTFLTKDFGINKVYKFVNTDNIQKVVVNYYANYDGVYYEVPVTEYVNDTREKLEIIFDELSSLSNIGLISLIDEVNLLDYEISDDVIRINLSKDITDDEIDLFTSSVFANYDVSKIDLFVNNQKKFGKTIEK